jgi:hypothetical protein
MLSKVVRKIPESGYFLVSILVLMDYALEAIALICLAFNLIVSILVLMDYALEVRGCQYREV